MRAFQEIVISIVLIIAMLGLVVSCAPTDTSGETTDQNNIGTYIGTIRGVHVYKISGYDYDCIVMIDTGISCSFGEN